MPADYAPLLWPDIQELLREKGQKWLEVVDEKEIYGCLLSGQWEAWIATQGEEMLGLMVCAWEHHSRQRFYHVLWGGGTKLYLYLQMGLEKIEKYACMNETTEIVIGGRPGWSRKLASLGYAPKRDYVELRKNVTVLWSN